MKFHTLFVFIILFKVKVNCESKSNIEVIELGTDAVKTLNTVQKIINRYSNYSLVSMSIRNKTETILFGKIETSMTKLSLFASKYNKIGSQTMNNIIEMVPEQEKLVQQINKLLKYLRMIEVFQEEFDNYYVKRRKSLTKSTLKTFAKFIISDNSRSINNVLSNLYRIFVPDKQGQTGLIEKLNDFFKENKAEFQCKFKQSHQQIYYLMYNMVNLAEIRGYVMLRYSYMLLKVLREGNFTDKSNVTSTNFEKRTNKIMKLFGSVMKSSSRELWTCDPKEHIKDETYTEITRLLQGFIANEIVLNTRESCAGTCSDYEFVNVKNQDGCAIKNGTYRKNWYCRETMCSGKIRKCTFYGDEVRACFANSQSGRRYDFIEFNNDKVLGERTACKKSKEDENWFWWFTYCDLCFCLCDEMGAKSDRYFNMRPTIADIKNNKVVTGLRFIKNNRIIHLQIQEGKLLPRGIIDPATVRWVPVDNYKLTDRKLYENQDYHVLKWEERGIDLDDLQAEDGFLVTGVRFKRIGAHLNFEILTTKFNFETGQLIDAHGTSHWVDNVNTRFRTEVHLNRPDIPTRSGFPSAPMSKTNQYIKFTHSDINKDAAQTTVPFIDTQSVASSLPMPLNGAGIFYKGRYGFGGFIAPKMFTYDISKHFQIRDNN